MPNRFPEKTEIVVSSPVNSNTDVDMVPRQYGSSD